MVYQELFDAATGAGGQAAAAARQRTGSPLEATAKIDARIRRLFPFELTAGQKQAIAEIAADMAGPLPMNRLLQGDVGSGKTVVAVYAMLLAVAHGYQAVLMAPTEVLARQHAQTLERLLAASQPPARAVDRRADGQSPRRTLLPADRRRRDRDRVGTQAIIQEDVRFAKLGLVVIDEQHKFGVRQRAALKNPAVRSALPGDDRHAHPAHGHHDAVRRPRRLDACATARRAGRRSTPIWPTRNDRAQWWEFFRKKLREGRQGYVVTPLVEESDAGRRRPAWTETYETAGQRRTGGVSLGLIHGRMTPAEKDAVMDAFPPRRDPGAGGARRWSRWASTCPTPR